MGDVHQLCCIVTLNPSITIEFPSQITIYSGSITILPWFSQGLPPFSYGFSYVFFHDVPIDHRIPRSPTPAAPLGHLIDQLMRLQSAVDQPGPRRELTLRRSVSSLCIKYMCVYIIYIYHNMCVFMSLYVYVYIYIYIYMCMCKLFLS